MAVIDIIVRAIDRTKAVFGKINKSLDKMRNRLNSVGGLLTGGIFAAGLLKSIKLASDLEEETNKFNVVFGAVQDEATEMARVLVDSFGQSELGAKKLLASTGDLLTGFGFTDEVALQLASTTAQLGADLASFSNIEGGAAAATQRLTKALLGETESAKELGIVISQDVLKRKAQEKGIKLVNGQISVQQRAILTLELALEQSGKAIGDLDRSSESFANQLKFVQNTMETVMVSIGEFFIPLLQTLFKSFLEMDSGVRIALIALTALTVVFLTLGGPVTLIVAAIGAFIAIIGALAKRNEKFARFLQTVWAVISTTVTTVISIIINHVSRLIDAFIKVAKAMADPFNLEKWKEAGGAIKDVTLGLVTDVSTGFQEITTAGFNAWNGIEVASKESTERVVLNQAEAIAKMQELLAGADGLEATSKKATDKVMQNTSVMSQVVADSINNVSNAIGDTLGNAIVEMDFSFKGLGDTFKNLVKDMIKQLISLTVKMLILNAVASAFPGLGGGGGAISGFFQTPAGGRRTVPGSSTTEVPIIAHGGEDIGRGGNGGNISISIGVATDPDGTASAIKDLLRDHENRTGVS